MPKRLSAPFIWIPGQGPDPKILDQMTRTFQKPSDPMGEAWFMSEERQMYPQLLGDLDALDDEDLEKALEEIALGTSAFGPFREWTEWFHYLLPRLINRRWSASYGNQAELLMSAFVALHPHSAGSEPYGAFRSDALATLGQTIMAERFWPNGDLDVEECLGNWTAPSGVAGWRDADGLLSASLFFCLKYLPIEAIEPWFRSVIAIANKYWRLQITTWLVGAHAILTDEISQPSEFGWHGPYDVDWRGSSTLKGNYSGIHNGSAPLIPFLPEENRAIVLCIGRNWDIEDFLEDFLTDPGNQEIAREVMDLPEQFFRLYKTAPPGTGLAQSP